MTSQRRKIAAIMFTDIVGYSALSHRNETLALELLEEHRRLVRPLLDKFHGREIKTIGDAFLVEFDSAVEAADCALTIQDAFTRRNQTEGPGRTLELRIGIHLGDIVMTDDDVHGDGVNIAARLVSRASANEVLVSRQLFEQIRSQPTWEVANLGKKRLKNISSPVTVFRLRLRDRPAANFKSPRKSAPMLAGMLSLATLLVLGLHFLKPSRSRTLSPLRAVPGRTSSIPVSQAIAILPFRISPDRGGGNEEDAEVADGLTGELIRTLSRIPQVRIASRERVMTFKDSALSPSEIGHALRVGAVVKGEVHRNGNQIGILAHWIDVATGQARWSESESGSLNDLFALQQRLAQRMSRQLRQASGPNGAPSPGRGLAAAEVPWPERDHHSSAYLSYLKGRHFLGLRTHESLLRAISYFERAIAGDPQLSAAYTGTAMAYDMLAFYEFLAPKVAFTEGSRFAEKGLLLDGESAEAYLFLGEKRAKLDHDWAGAENGYRRAIALAPASPTAHQWYGNLLMSLNRFEDAKREAQAAVDLEPLNPIYLNYLGVSYSFSGQYEQAFRIFQELIELEPSYPYAHFSLGLALIESGNPRAGLMEMEKADKLAPKSPMIQAGLAYAHARAGQRPQAEAALAKWRAQGKQAFISSYLLAEIHSGLGETPQALGALEQALENHDTHLLFLAVDPVFRGLRSEPRFQTILQKLNLAGL